MCALGRHIGRVTYTRHAKALTCYDWSQPEPQLERLLIEASFTPSFAFRGTGRYQHSSGTLTDYVSLGDKLFTIFSIFPKLCHVNELFSKPIIIIDWNAY